MSPERRLRLYLRNSCHFYACDMAVGPAVSPAETARLQDELRREQKQRQRCSEALEAALLRNGGLEHEVNELRFSNRKLKVRIRCSNLRSSGMPA